MNGKVCVVTGATSGVGRATAMILGSTGATVILVCRDRKRGEAIKKEIIRKTKNKNISVMFADFTYLHSIKQLAKKFKEHHQYLHILINNAGVLHSKRILTKDGYETTFQVNYLAPFLLTNLLLRVIKKSAPSRIVNVTSDEHIRGSIDFDNLHGEKHYGGYWAYARSKLALILFTYKLAEKLVGTKVTVNCVHPGSIATNIGRNSSGIMGLYFKVGKRFMKKPEQGAEEIVYLATSSEAEKVTGKYFIDKTISKSSKLSYDKVVADRLWKKTIDLIGKRFVIL
ncbi:MAG: SDR family oxidoreductase [Candidatus Micrarchaeota archaeon]|nr:SDR family oxidoreductase [Candidatus Micrarchaeota archaeon]MDE1847891.1 SDR family oxidoreductase [Candidatus Micrarchaeota archaeon]MDE1864517.1 SDR family oxidoreductase [Candidatus Micrarchaeota archaeon]